jgi:hypothetical protein
VDIISDALGIYTHQWKLLGIQFFEMTWAYKFIEEACKICGIDGMSSKKFYIVFSKSQKLIRRLNTMELSTIRYFSATTQNNLLKEISESGNFRLTMIEVMD